MEEKSNHEKYRHDEHGFHAKKNAEDDFVSFSAKPFDIFDFRIYREVSRHEVRVQKNARGEHDDRKDCADY